MECRFWVEKEKARDGDNVVDKNFVKFEKFWSGDVKQSVGGRATAKEAVEYPLAWKNFLEANPKDTFEFIVGCPGVDDSFVNQNAELQNVPPKSPGSEGQNEVDQADAEMKKEVVPDPDKHPAMDLHREGNFLTTEEVKKGEESTREEKTEQDRIAREEKETILPHPMRDSVADEKEAEKREDRDEPHVLNPATDTEARLDNDK